MKSLLTLLTLLIINTCYAQQKRDSTPFGTILEEGASVKKELAYSSYAYLQPYTAVLIGGADKFDGKEYFEVYYRSKKYYIEPKELSTRWTFAEIEAYTPEERDTLAAQAEYSARSFYIKELNDVQSAIKKTKVAGLGILDWTTYDESEYTSGTGIEVSVINPTSKTIKYIWFSVIGYNAVDDKVFTNGTSVKTKKAIGPIKPDGIASYKFEYMWMTDIVETSKLYSIKVQYMDGTFKTIANPKSVILNADVKELLDQIDEDD